MVDFAGLNGRGALLMGMAKDQTAKTKKGRQEQIREIDAWLHMVSGLNGDLSKAPAFHAGATLALREELTKLREELNNKVDSTEER